MLDRITFLKVLGVSAVWPWLDSARLLAIPEHPSPAERAIASPQFDLLFATAEAFRPHIDTTFLVQSETGARAALRLASVVGRSHCARAEQFSMNFHAPDGTACLEGICAFEHQVLGRFDLFIAPVGAATVRPVVYEACFSRMISHG